jgi:hypothetical protein
VPTEKSPSRPTSQDAARRLLILRYVVLFAVAAPPRKLLEQMTSAWDADTTAEVLRKAEVLRDQPRQQLRDAGLWQHLSPREETLAKSTIVTMTEKQQVDASWRVEAAQTLMWALGLLPTLPLYDIKASHDVLNQIPTNDPAAFVNSAKLRDQAEIDRARDTAEFWHWRSRTRELIERGEPFPTKARRGFFERLRARLLGALRRSRQDGTGFRSFDDIVRFSARAAAQKGSIPPTINDDFPAKNKAYRDLTSEEWSEVTSITMERHFTLNWLCGYAPDNRWDETPTDT